MTFAQYYWPPLALGVAVLLPAVLLLGGTIKGKLAQKHAASGEAEKEPETAQETAPSNSKKPKRKLRRTGIGDAEGDA
jgi:hypothetical protein